MSIVAFGCIHVHIRKLDAMCVINVLYNAHCLLKYLSMEGKYMHLWMFSVFVAWNPFCSAASDDASCSVELQICWNLIIRV